MSRPEHTPHTPSGAASAIPSTTVGHSAGQVEAAIADLDRSLRRLHLTPQARSTILAEIRTDLDAAAADGLQPACLIGTNPDAFAYEAAVAGGHAPHLRYHRRVLTGGVTGTAIATVLGYLMVAEAPLAPLSAGGGAPGPTPVLGFVTVLGGIALAGAVVGFIAAHVAAVRRRPAALGPSVRTAIAATVTVVMAGVLGLALLPPTASVISATVTALVIAVGVAAGLALRATRPRVS